MKNSIIYALLVIAEIITFVLVAKSIGLGWTILALGICGLIGLLVAAAQLRRGLAKAQRLGAAGATSSTNPATTLLDAAARTIGVVLMVVPGFITFGIGALALFPPTRALFRGLLSAAAVKTTRKFEAKMADTLAFGGGSASPFGFSTQYDGPRANPFGATVIDAEDDLSPGRAATQPKPTADPERRAAGNPADPRYDN